MSEVTIKKTTGVETPNGKNFRVDLSNGQSWMVLRTTTGFATTIGRSTYNGSLKAMKELIVEHANSGDLNGSDEPVIKLPDESAVDPCALLVVLTKIMNGIPENIHLHIKKTLYEYGWDPRKHKNGQSDLIAQAYREIERAENSELSQ
jgi:hypothetical protein